MLIFTCNHTLMLILALVFALCMVRSLLVFSSALQMMHAEQIRASVSTGVVATYVCGVHCLANKFSEEIN